MRKISIGISKKDLIYLRSKEKSAFYNCFVIVLRTIYNDSFKEFHVKIFNTGKLEIPGIQNDKMMYIIITDIIDILRNIVNDSINYLENRIENILINSNFNCGFYINREKLFDILRYKYYINACYDPCSYPGIQCMYYYDNNTNNDNVVTTEKKKITKILSKQEIKDSNIFKISYMIFRTGSILIVGKCDDIMLMTVYNYIKEILYNEYDAIVVKNNDPVVSKEKKSLKKKKKIIYITS